MDDAEARFTRLYEHCYPRVLTYAMRRISPDPAREVADETFLVASRRWQEIPDGVALPWLLVVARNVLSEHYRRGRREDALAAELARLAATVSEPSPESAVVERVTVLSALAQLAQRDREALMLTVWDQLTNLEAAAVMGCSAATFAVRLYRARRRLADALEQLDHHSMKQVSAGVADAAGASTQSAVTAGRKEQR